MNKKALVLYILQATIFIAFIFFVPPGKGWSNRKDRPLYNKKDSTDMALHAFKYPEIDSLSSLAKGKYSSKNFKRTPISSSLN
jgi:hypothetical protein